ncbi:MAG TPA: glycosyltransferase family 2 protein [Crinalium sp.]
MIAQTAVLPDCTAVALDLFIAQDIMPDNPLVSILINNYNYGNFLGDAIASALNQTYPHVEVVVVDDGSTDHSREVIAQYRDQYGDRLIPVLKENGGQASAFNAGFAASHGEIICILDADDLFLPQKAVELVELFKRDRDLGWCFHPLRLVDANAQPLPETEEYQSSQVYDFRAHIQQHGKLPYDAPATSGLCFRRSLLDKILPMPQAHKISLGDHYLKFTALALSKGMSLGHPLACQRVHGTNAYTLIRDNRPIKARILMLTAYWIRVNFPEFTKFTNNLLARSLSLYWRSGGVESEQQPIVQRYLDAVSLPEKLEIQLRAFFRYLLPT